MKKTLALALAAGLVAAAFAMPAEAGKKKRKTRVVQGTYANPALGVPGVAGTSSAGGAVEIPLSTKEYFISVEITDDAGQPVTATMSQDTNPDTPTWEIFATICGGTEEPIEVVPGVPVRVSVYAGPGPDQPTCTGPATSGTVKATLSNLP